MRSKIRPEFNPVAAAVLSVAVAASLVACGGGSSPQPQEKLVAEAPPAADAASQAELEARSQQLAQREADLAAKEQELENARAQAAQEAADREREAAAKAAAAKKAAVAKPRPPKTPTATPARTESAQATPAPSREPVEVPAGTQLPLALTNDLSSKTAKPGDAFEARLVSDLMVGDRRALPAGTRATGTISKVVSGSDKIGTTPTLELKFDHLELASGRQIPISGQLTQLGKSEKGRDAAKIIGGVAAGAIVGSQVKKGGTGTIVGGLLGGAAGAVVAQKTGTEVTLADGSTITITLDQAIKVPVE